MLYMPTGMDTFNGKLAELASFKKIESEYWNILSNNLEKLPPDKRDQLNAKVVTKLYKNLNNNLMKAALWSSDQIQRLEVEAQNTLPVDEVDK